MTELPVERLYLSGGLIQRESDQRCLFRYVCAEDKFMCALGERNLTTSRLAEGDDESNAVLPEYRGSHVKAAERPCHVPRFLTAINAPARATYINRSGSYEENPCALS